MPTLNSIKYMFTGIDIKYSSDAYDVYTEGIRLLMGEVPKSFYVKCVECGKRVKMNDTSFGPADFILLCDCGEICLASCMRAKEDYFHISI